MSKGKLLPKFGYLLGAILMVLFFTGCIGEGVGRDGAGLDEEDAPEVSSTPTSFEFLSEANSLSSKNLKTTLTVQVTDAFGVAVDNVQVKFSLTDATDSKILQLGSLATGSEVVVLSENGESDLEITAKASGLPSKEVTVKAEIVGYGNIPSKTLKVFVKEIPLSFTVQDLPQILFNKGEFEFVSIQVRDPEGNSVNGVDVEIDPVDDSPLKFYDIQTTLKNGVPSGSQKFKFTTEGDGIVSFNLWASATSGTQPITTHFNIKVGSSSNQAVPSDDVKIFFVELTNIGSLDDLKANGHDSRTLSVELDGTDIDSSEYYIRWKTTLGSIAGKGSTVSKKLPYSEFDENDISEATLSVSNESGTAVITASLINSLADDNDSEVVVAEISYEIAFKEVKPATLSIIANNASLVAGGGNIFTLSGQVLDKDGIGINNITIPVTVAGDVALEVVDQVVTSTISENKGAFKFNASAFNLAGRWTITVKADTISNSISIEQLSDKPSAILVNDGKEPESIFVKGTGNKENTSVTFKALDRFGNSISDNLGVKIVVSIASGPGGGEQVDPTVPTETVNGIVSANIRAGNRSGTVRVHAEIENNPTISADTNISIAKGPLDASSINLEPEFNNIAGRHVLFLEETVTASLADSAGDAVPDGQGVTFVTKGTGNFFKNGTGNTSLGFATDTLVTAANPDPFFGFSVLTAEANGGEDVYVTAMSFLSNSTIVLAGTKGGGVKKSNSITKGSVNWVDNNGDFPWLGQIIYDLKIPDNTTSVFAATDSGLYKSSNLGSTWSSIRSEQNSNKPGFVLRSLNTSTITAVAFANAYLNNSSASDPETDARNPDDVDVLVGTNGEGVWYNGSRGESFSVVDADGTATDGRAYASATVIDGAFLTAFDIGKASNLYHIATGSKTGFLLATDVDDAATYEWVVVVPSGAALPTVNEFKATDGTGAESVNSHRFPNLAFNDKNDNSIYDDGEEIVATGYVDSVFNGGWTQSGTLGTGSFIKRLASQKSSSTNYVIAATTDGVMASIGTSSVGAVWSNIGTNGSGVFIRKALINDVYLKSDLTLYAATGEYGIYKFTGLSSISKTPVTVTSGWSKLGTPKGADTVLSNAASATGYDDTALSILDTGDRLFYKDSDGNGKFSGKDQLVIIPAGQTVPTISVYPSTQAIDTSAKYLPAETASEFLRYVDIDEDSKFTYTSDILVLDWNDNLVFDESKDDYQSFNAVIEHTFGSTAYIFVAATSGGVFYAPVSNTTTWKQLDIRDTNSSAKRFYSDGGNLYICTSKNTEIVEVSAVSTTELVTTDVPVITARSINKGESGAGSIDTKIRGSSTIVSSGTITPKIEYWPSYNQYVQNITKTTLYNELTQTQMLQLLIDNSMLRTGTLLRVSSTSSLELTATNNRTLMGSPSNALGTITYVGVSYVIETPVSGTIAAGNALYQPAATNANSTVLGTTLMSTITTVTALNNLLTSLGITLTGDNEAKTSQLVSAGLISSSYGSAAAVIDSYSISTLLFLARGLTDINKVLMTDPSTEEGKMYFYSKITLEDSNGNPPVAGTKIEIEIKEVQTDVDTTGTIADITRTYVRFTFEYTYADIENRGPSVTQYLQQIACSAITRLPSEAPTGTAYDDTVVLTVAVTAPSTTDTAPGTNGTGLASASYTISRSSFTPTGGGTLIRQ